MPRISYFWNECLYRLQYVRPAVPARHRDEVRRGEEVRRYKTTRSGNTSPVTNLRLGTETRRTKSTTIIMRPQLTLVTLALLVVVAGVWALPNPVSETPQSRDDAVSATTSPSTAAPESKAESGRRQSDCKCTYSPAEREENPSPASIGTVPSK
ncbi:uncharacterized protein LOC105691256 [Athalia rosae]|uniref:uncharacterized protein LOC105691256 n=1 Tax=Athalia rosae TaxID=37344 RepID=UPI00203457E3|nr:uncharacterized protein LOC105691256 [Athalia rosae]